MSASRQLDRSERWFRLLLRFYPADFREEMGDALVEAYRDRCRFAREHGGAFAVSFVWIRAFFDFLTNGVAERLRPAIAWRRSGSWGRDMEGVLRRLTRAPVFTLAVVGTLTVGLGAFATVFTVVQKVLLEPLPYERPDDLYWAWRDYSAIFDLERGWLAGTDVVAFDTAGGPIAGAVGVQRSRVTLTSVEGADPAEIAVMYSTDNLFRILGVGPVLGRGFAPGESGADRPGVVVLGYDLWRSRFGADSGILGRDIRLDEEQVTVIGVMGPEFHFARHSSLGPPETADAYATYTEDLATTNPNSGSYAGLIRGKPGVSPEAVQDAIAATGRHLDERDFSGRGLRWYAVPAKADLVSDVRPALIVLGLAGGFLVLVLAVNLATLLLARAAQREREFAISRALGANPVALAGATVFEGGVLGLLGAIGGALAAAWGVKVLVALAPLQLPRRDAIELDAGITGIVLVTGALLGLLAGALPAAWVTRSSLTTLLSKAAVRGGGGTSGWMRRGLVVVQVALSLILLSTGGLVVKSFEHLLQSEPGFVPDGVLTLRIPMSGDRYSEDEQVLAMHQRLHDALLALPGVRAVGATTSLPLTGNVGQRSIILPGAPGNTGQDEHDKPLIDFAVIRPSLLTTLSIPILEGRDLVPSTDTTTKEVLVDRTLAAEFYPNGSAVGHTLVTGGDTAVIVGVVEHARQYELHEDGRPQVFARTQDYTAATLSWAIHTTRDPASLVPEVRAAVWRLDPELALSEVRPMDRIVAESLRQQRLSATLIGGFSLGALLLAAMGLFGVVSGAVARRRHELAVRMALGAPHRRVLRLVLREGALLIGLGILIAVPALLLTGQALRATLVGVSPFDPVTLLAVVVGLALVTLAACYVPARRVTGIEPASALRQE